MSGTDHLSEKNKRFQYSFSIDANEEERFLSCLCRKLGIRNEDIGDTEILKKSLDARKKPSVRYNYTVVFTLKNTKTERILLKKGAFPYKEPAKYRFPEIIPESIPGEKSSDRPVVVGFGPAGIFAALYLSRAGLCPVILERGAAMEERIAAVEEFHAGGKLRPDTNVQFGEGGAGTFSDGKLNTGVKDKEGRNTAVLKTFVEFGAPEEILYDGRAHIGTDVIRKVVVNIRNEIIRLGGDFYFHTQFVKPEIKDGKLCGILVKNTLEQENPNVTAQDRLNTDGPDDGEKADSNRYLPCSDLILAVGHSARDTYETLYGMNFPMKTKSFAVGFRVIHPAKFINECQYGEGYEKNYPNLPAAYYKFAYESKNGRNVYSFCMCPGGYVVNASSEEERLAVNGMSNAKRDGEFSNAAVVMNVGPADFNGGDVLAGMRYQRALEEAAYKLGNGKIPVCRYRDFCKSFETKEEENTADSSADAAVLSEGDKITADYYKDAVYGDFQTADLSTVFSASMNESFAEGMEYFNRIMSGFADVNPLLCAVESRTSAPVRIERDESFQSLDARGIYPCGEGAGYAGGITSAAMDGLKCAEALLKKRNGQENRQEETQ